ncbi:MAG: single-stranded DNA-binding protein [Mariprofundaceae bacterium]|nr:single-stranded DNA-binding protein [Mariprofundaceae bacterium]
MLNKAILIGNLGQDPETRFMQDGTCVCNISIATTERFKNREGERQDRTEWHRVVLWGKLGEIANQYLRKGSQVYIEGKIETRKWKDRDGNDKYTTEIRANEMKMLGGRRDDNASQGQGGGQYQQQNAAPAQNNWQNQPPAQQPAQQSTQQPSQQSTQQQHENPFDDGAYNGPSDNDVPF